MPVSSKRRLTPVNVDRAERMASSAMPASLADGDGGKSVERIVLAGDGDLPAAKLPLAAAHARAELGVDDDAAALLRQAAQDEVGAARGAVGEQAAAVTAQLEPLDHVARHRMIDAGDGEAIEGNVAEEGLELAMHVLDRLEVVEVLGVDVGDDADLRRQAHEGAVALVGLDDHPLALAEARVGAPVLDDAAGDHRRIDAGRGEDVGDERGRRRLAVRAGDRHGRIEPHQLGEHLGAADDGKALGARRLELRVAGLDGGGDDDERAPTRLTAS